MTRFALGVLLRLLLRGSHFLEGEMGDAVPGGYLLRVLGHPWRSLLLRGRMVYRMVLLSTTVGLTSCNSGCPPPSNTLQPWTNYPHLVQVPTINRNWLIIKCTLSDNRNVPSGLDVTVNRFLTPGGAGTGNIVDYYADVSYGEIALTSTVYGWFPAPFNGTEPGLAGNPGRKNRVQGCANSIPASVAANIDFSGYWGIIAVVNHGLDDGACYNGQSAMTIQGGNYNLACVTFNPTSLYTGYAAHEVGHGLGMPHSFDNSQNMCGQSLPGEYQDKWDIMSAQCTYEFSWANYPPEAGPGTNLPNLLFLQAIPKTRIATYQIGSSVQTIPLRALSHPVGLEPLGAEIIGPSPYDVYTVEYRQQDGWDTGAPVNAVLIHQYKVGANPYSYLQENTGTYPGAWLQNTSWTDPAQQVKVSINSIDPSSATASVSIGPAH